jgi:YVTN family beta-propeller protein
MTIDQPDASVLINYPVKFAGATPDVIVSPPPPANVPVEGLPQGSFKEVVKRDGSREGAVQAVIDPPTGGVYLNMVLYMKGPRDSVRQLIERKPVTPAEQNEPVYFYVYQSLLDDGVHVFTYEVERASGNSGPSTESWVLYHRDLPGGNNVPGTGAHPNLEISLPAELGDTPHIGKEKMDAGVPCTLSYIFRRAYDQVTLELNRYRFHFTVQPEQVDKPYVITITREMLELAGNSPRFEISYTVVDQLNNPTDKRRWSRVIDGQSTPGLAVAFSNGPYEVAPGGRLNDVKLSLARAGQPVAGKITVVLPAGSQYADGTSGARDFSTQLDGTLTIEGIKGAAAAGAYTLTASSGGHTTTETLTVMAYAQPGVIAVGALIQGVTLSSDGRRAYVRPANGSSLAVIDTAKAKVERYIPINGQGSSVQHALSRDGGRIYAGFYQTQQMEILDLKEERTIASFPVGRACFNVTLSQDETLAFVSNSHDATVNVIDVRNLQSVKTMTVGQAPNQIVVHPDGSRIYIAVVSSSSIVVIDSRSLTQVAAFPLKAPPIGLAMSPDGRSIFADVVINNTTEEIVQVDAHTGALIRAIPIAGLARGIVVNHRGTRAYCCNPHTHTVSTIDIQSGAVIQRVPVGRQPLRMAISPDDSLGYVSCYEDGTVWVISLQPVWAGGLSTSFGEVLEHVEPGSVKPVPGDEYLGLPG